MSHALMRAKGWFALCFLVLLFFANVGRADTDRRSLVSDDFYRVAEISDPQVSADGAWVAYVVEQRPRSR